MYKNTAQMLADVLRRLSNLGEVIGTVNTIKAVAKAGGVSESSVSKLIYEERSPRADTLDKILNGISMVERKQAA